jgi:hypothetical protein
LAKDNGGAIPRLHAARAKKGAHSVRLKAMEIRWAVPR